MTHTIFRNKNKTFVILIISLIVYSCVQQSESEEKFFIKQEIELKEPLKDALGVYVEAINKNDISNYSFFITIKVPKNDTTVIAIDNSKTGEFDLVNCEAQYKAFAYYNNQRVYLFRDVPSVTHARLDSVRIDKTNDCDKYLPKTSNGNSLTLFIWKGNIVDVDYYYMNLSDEQINQLKAITGW